MSDIIKDPVLISAIQDLARGIKSEADLSSLTRELLKITVEASLKGDHGMLEIETPRDRNGIFEPQFVRKNQTRLTHFDDKILTLYAKGMTTRDIVDTFQEMYGAAISPTQVSTITEAVMEKIIEWQSRPLDEVYPIIYLDCIVVKIRQDKRVINKAVYVALGVTMQGHKELLGLWLSENEGAKFWLSVLTELIPSGAHENRGIKDVFVACVDGLTGFPDAIGAVFPKTQVQLCIVHRVRNSLRFVSWKDRKLIAAGLKKIYQSITVAEAERNLMLLLKLGIANTPQSANPGIITGLT